MEMSAKELLELAAGPDGLDIDKGIEALEQGVQRLVADGEDLAARLAEEPFDKKQFAHVAHHLAGLTTLRCSLMRPHFHADRHVAVPEAIQLDGLVEGS